MLPELNTWRLNRKYEIIKNNVYILIIKTSSFSYFFKDTTRLEAIKLLMNPENPLGTFLVRPSESFLGDCAISVKILKKKSETPTINHYRIKNVKYNGVTYHYIADGKVYSSINELIQQYTSGCLNQFIWS